MKKKLSVFMVLTLLACGLLAGCGTTKRSNVTVGTSCVSLGADLTEGERASVLAMLNLTEESLAASKLITVTNAREHEVLDSVFGPEVSGTKAQSCCRVIAREDGHGITVSTQNVNFVTNAMYENALATAGMRDAELLVAAPFPMPGTAALIGAMEAYSALYGTKVDNNRISGAAEEMSVTEQIAETLNDPQKAAAYIAAVKAEAAAEKNASDDKLDEMIDSVAAQLGFTLSEEEHNMVRVLLRKLEKLHISSEELVGQARGIYDYLKSQGLDMSRYGASEEDVEGFFGVIGKMWDDFMNWLGSLFH